KWAGGVPSGISGMGASLKRTAAADMTKRRPRRIPATRAAIFMSSWVGVVSKRVGEERRDLLPSRSRVRREDRLRARRRSRSGGRSGIRARSCDVGERSRIAAALFHHGVPAPLHLLGGDLFDFALKHPFV